MDPGRRALLFPGRCPDGLARRRPLYLLTLVFLCIPFFFSFMALRNEFSPAWTGSCVVAFVMVLYLLEAGVHRERRRPRGKPPGV